jgi:hypothetical protein
VHRDLKPDDVMIGHEAVEQAGSFASPGLPP